MVSTCLVCIGFSAFGAGALVDSDAVKGDFVSPGREFATAPLWVWNDYLTEEQLTFCLEALATEGVKQVFVHPRPGLMTPYLSDDWFRLWKHCLTEAERLDMNVWIYDENSYPSCFAGGFVPEAMPDSRAQGVSLKRVKKPAVWHEGALAVFQKDGDGYRDVTKKVTAGSDFSEGTYIVARIEEARQSPWYGGWWHTDLLRRDVTEKFLEVTLEAYRKQFGGAFPERVPGSFTDEPHLRGAGDIHWTRGLPEMFRARWGYDLIENLPCLVEETGDWKRVRHNYQQLMLEKFIENWAMPYYEYCERHGIEFTGHYWEHGWPNPGIGPDNMAMSAWQQRPGIDMLFNDPYNALSPHAQVGNTRAVLEVGSVANQLGRGRTLCEAYGGSGWDMRFEDMKRIGDWLYVLGINTMDQHLSHMTLRGARKRDYPPTFSYHSPWWEYYDVLAERFARLSAALSQGRQLNKILLIEPTTTAWMYDGDRREAVGNAFQKLVAELLAAQIEFDLGSEDVIARNGSVAGGEFVVGERGYTTVVLPPEMENVNKAALELLLAFGEAGGRIIGCAVPSRVDGAESERPAALANVAGYAVKTPAELAAALQPGPDAQFQIRRSEHEALLFHQRRVLDDGELLFLVNTSTDKRAAGEFRAAAKGIEFWDAETGAVYGYSSKPVDDGVAADFELPPAGSMLLFLAKDAVNLPPKPAPGGQAVEPSSGMDIRRDGPNVLTLDYVDVEAGGEKKTGVPFKEAAQLAFKKNGLDRNPWDHAVQFRDEFLKLTFPEDSGFTVTYRFNIDGAAPKPLHFVVERPDLYEIACNGKTVSATGEWWLDRAFGKIDISDAARAGENVVTLKASPFSVFHEIEAAFVLGDFAVKPAERGFAIAAASPLQTGPWNEQGCPLYGHGVTYTQRFDVSEASGRYFVSLPDWYGSVANVRVNGKPAGRIYSRPWACDVTEFIERGANTVEVTVIGTLRNTLGPHHGNQRLGFAGPGSWNQAPETGPPSGAGYETVGYGLFRAFELLHKK